MLTFRQYLTEALSRLAVVTLIGKKGKRLPCSPTSHGIQFVLPSGQGIELDGNLVHARAVYEAGDDADVPMQLIDVLQAGIVRAASDDMYQVCSTITDEQAQFMFDRCLMNKRDTLTISVASAAHAAAQQAKVGVTRIGPIEIDDKTSKIFDLSRAKPSSVRSWVNGQSF